MAWPQDVRRDQLRIEYYKGSGAGGQHRNKTSSACRITHVPTGKVARCESHRHQDANRREAFRKLSDQLVPMMREDAREFEPEISSEVVRSYHAIRGEVKDHRVPGERWGYDSTLDGKTLADIHKHVIANK